MLQQILAIVTAQVPEDQINVRTTPPLFLLVNPGPDAGVVTCTVSNVSGDTHKIEGEMVSSSGTVINRYQAMFGGPVVHAPGTSNYFIGRVDVPSVFCRIRVLDGTRADIRTSIMYSTETGRVALAGE